MLIAQHASRMVEGGRHCQALQHVAVTSCAWAPASVCEPCQRVCVRVWSGAGDVMWYVMSFTRYCHRLRPPPGLGILSMTILVGSQFIEPISWPAQPCLLAHPTLMPVINVFCQLISVWLHCCTSMLRCTHCTHTNLCKYTYMCGVYDICE